MKSQVHDIRSFCELLKNNKLLTALLAACVLLLLIPRGGRRGTDAARDSPTVIQFDLQQEEKRIEDALKRIQGAGEVKVLLTVDSAEEREYARDTDENSSGDSGGVYRSDKSSHVTNMSGEALTVKCIYPSYRGALVVVTGSGSTLKLEITRAVSALTGLSTDKITVANGNS